MAPMGDPTVAPVGPEAKEGLRGAVEAEILPATTVLEWEVGTGV